MFKIGNVVECIESSSEADGGPKLGERFTVTAADDWGVGFPLPRLRGDFYNEKIRSGAEVNWNKRIFKLVSEKEFMHISYLLTKGSITLHYEGKTKVVAKDDERFEKILQAIRDAKMDLIPEIVEPELALKKQGLDVEDGLVMVNGEAMPTELNSRIMEYKEHGLPFNSLLKFWENLKQNPSFNSRQQLFKFLQNKGHSITEDGCFIGYRGVRDDYKDKHSGKFDNSPGSICEMPRDQVDDNPNNTCSHGLHVGGYDYAKYFGANGKLMMVKVNPKDVVAVPNDYDGQKMRVCRFEVLKETTEFLQTPLFSDENDTEEDLLHAENAVAYISGQPIMPFMQTTTTISIPKNKNYSNNHAKRGPDGKFIPKKKVKKINKKSKKTGKKAGR